MGIKISYAVTVCNEFIEIQRLLTFLLEYKRPQDEIVVQMDLSLDDLKNQPEDKREVFTYIMKYNSDANIKLRAVFYPLNNNFGAFKNNLTKECTGDYIFQIDADELPHPGLIEILPELLEANPELDVFLVPRINTVEGLTPEHIAKWGWNVNEKGWVNFPDFQWRIWRNVDTISWINKVHERLDGFNMYTALPSEELFCIYHPKTIDKQEKQNSYYDTL
jgi:glycosyltransferase involved in cell wall biosynthesis